jgi:hypothetical protein
VHARDNGFADDLVNFYWDPVTAAVALGWPVAEIETRPLAAELHGEHLEFRPTPNGRPTRVVTRVDTVAFDERWLSAIRATCR